MAKISVLAPEIREKIAAGEVITRPSSVVKELIENALDADAGLIDIEIEDGGKRKCLVNDDGSGMSKEDALLSIQRFTTSKIKTLDDVEAIHSYGFRGEALASIAQISNLELETSDGSEGTTVNIVAGEIKAIHESHRNKGTRVKVTDLFFNLPVRRKFLKSSDWERRLIINLVETYALAKPAVSFTLEETGRKLLNLPRVKSVAERINQLFKDISSSFILTEVKLGNLSLVAFLSKPDFAERHHVNYIFVNERPVKYPRIYRSVIDAYQNPKNLPALVIFIDIKPELVDVNIHPTKSEVKFRDERYVVDLLVQAIRKKIFKQASIVSQQHREVGGSGSGSGSGMSRTIFTAVPESAVQEPLIDYQTNLAINRESVEFWQLHQTYILAQTKSGMVIVDQHVAHERIIYESLINGRPSCQRLLFPITLELSVEEFGIYSKTRELLAALGIEFKEFSQRTLVIDSLPIDSKITRDDLVGFFSEIGSLGSLIMEKTELAKIVACRSAIKAGQRLSPTEMQNLVDRLFACENPYTCPHGRPIILKFSLDELAKKFGR